MDFLKDNTEVIPIYNCCSEIRCTIEEYASNGVAVLDEYPIEKKIWARNNFPTTSCWYNYFINFILFHLIPAFVVDGLLTMFRKKPMLLNIQRKVYICNIALEFFTTKDILFRTENYDDLPNQLLENDKQQFSFIVKDLRTFTTILIRGLKKYLLNEDWSVSERALQIDKGVKILDRTLRFALYVLVLYMVYSYRHIMLYQLDRFYRYVENL